MTQSIRSFLSKFGPKIASSTKNHKLCRTVSGLDQKHIETSSYIDKKPISSDTKSMMIYQVSDGSGYRPGHLIAAHIMCCDKPKYK
jgi:hypothetical protein